MKNVDIKKLFDLSILAGKEIMKVYKQDFKVEAKDDDSPLTIADKRSHEVITEGLEKEYVDIPVLSEEGPEISFGERKNWDAFWLVDPLDGTKEFIKKNGEFTVNIAFIRNKYPVLGVIYAPALDIFYFGKEGVGAFKLEQASKNVVMNEKELLEKSKKLPEIQKHNVVNVVASRSHMTKDTEAFINELKTKHDKVEVVSAGSSLKFCLVAEGKADYYPRYAPTMEWDTGAGQAVVEAAGGKVTRYKDHECFYYNKENLRNGWFLVQGEI